MSDHLYHQALSANRKLLEENDSLKADVQTLRHQAVHDISQLGEQSAEIASLKAEVERLRNLGIKLESMIDPLKAEVERLRKAGDAMLLALNKRDDTFDNSDKDNAIADWNAAKEGKPSV